MNIAVSTFPKHYDATFILEQAGVTNHYGYEVGESGTTFKYLPADMEAVLAAIEAYPVAYKAVMAPAMIHEASITRERKVSTFTFNGMTIPLNLETVANLTASAVGLERDPSRATVNWSLGKGQFVTIPRDVMLALADAAFAFVNDCFDAQKTIVEEIQSAADIEVLRQMDIANHPAWPD